VPVVTDREGARVQAFFFGQSRVQRLKQVPCALNAVWTLEWNTHPDLSPKVDAMNGCCNRTSIRTLWQKSGAFDNAALRNEL
jgi:hypothetical protein